MSYVIYYNSDYDKQNNNKYEEKNNENSPVSAATNGTNRLTKVYSAEC